MHKLSTEQEIVFLSDLLLSDNLDEVLRQIARRDPNGSWLEHEDTESGYDLPSLEQCRETIRDWITDLQS